MSIVIGALSYTLIFFDSSKSPSGVGAAFWIPSTSFSRLLSLPSFSSNFHAEQATIFNAIEYIIQNLASSSFLIIADSHSALQSLSSSSALSSFSLALPIVLLLSSAPNIFFYFL